MAKKHFTLAIAALALLTVLGFQMAPELESDKDIFTIYLVRHSEKDVAASPSDPPLTPCGQERSEHLSAFLAQVPVDAVYSTDYTRTQSTAAPTAQSKELSIISYDPSDLEGIAEQLINAKQDALVVGHSNTTGVLAGLLSGEEIGSFDESIYNRIYQVVIHKKCNRLHVLHTAFSCE